MLNELDLGYDDDADRPRRGRSARSGDPEHHRGHGKTLLALGLTLIILSLVGGAAWIGVDQLKGYFSTPDYNSGGTCPPKDPPADPNKGCVDVEVKDGDGGTAIAKTLFEKDVVKSSKAFIEAFNANPHSADVQPGKYALREKMRAADALAMLLDKDKDGRPVNKLSLMVTIPEGKTAQDIFKILAEKTALPVADFVSAASDWEGLGVPASWLVPVGTKQPMRSVEGFLFPATYELQGLSATQILKNMVKKFLVVAQALNLEQKARSKSLTPFEALITASLVEAEAGVPQDRGKIARVVYNRLAKPMNLEFDSCTNYWRGLQGQDRRHGLTTKELEDPTNPYRTYGLAGLPPGPIANPGEESLKAALDPTPGNWLYFVRIDKDGNSAFTNDLNQHLRNIQIAEKNGAY